MKTSLAVLSAACFVGLASCFKPRSQVRSQQVCTQQTVLKHVFSPRNYCPTLRPSAGEDPVTISHRFELIRLSSFDVNTDILCIDVWETVEYSDPRLAWNTDKCNVGSIRQPWDKIWTPDLEVYQLTAAAPGLVNQPLVTIDGTGNVLYTEAKQLKIYCDLPDPIVDGDYNCTFTLGSVAYGCSDVVPQVADAAGGLSLKYYNVPSLQMDQPWELISTSSSTYSAPFDCCPDPFCVIDYTITWRYHEMSTNWSDPPGR